MVELEISEYIRPENLKTGDRVTFVNEGRLIPENERRFGDFEVKVKLPDGKEKIWSPNKTTQRDVADEYGPETQDWVNKQAEITISSQNVMGETKQVIYGKPIKQVEDAGEVTSPPQKRLDE